MMEVARTSETLVNFYQTTRRYNPEDSHLRTHRRENLKSCLTLYFFTLPIDLSLDGSGCESSITEKIQSTTVGILIPSVQPVVCH
jgi:hypothetical protein